MQTISDHLRKTRIIEFLPLSSNPMYVDFVRFLKSEMPAAEFVAVRSVSADVFCVNFRGVDHIIWDETYVDAVLRFAAALLSENPATYKGPVQMYGLGLMGDLLFDEGLYIDAWFAGITGGRTANLSIPHWDEMEQLAKNIASSRRVA